MEREHLSELLQVSPESLTPTTLYDREIVPIRSVMDGVVIARRSPSARSSPRDLNLSSYRTYLASG
jgi:hypothetical protein